MWVNMPYILYLHKVHCLILHTARFIVYFCTSYSYCHFIGYVFFQLNRHDFMSFYLCDYLLLVPASIFFPSKQHLFSGDVWSI